jgi:S-adenosylmethionine synthetase
MRLVYAREGGYSPENAHTVAKIISDVSREMAESMARVVNKNSAQENHCYYLEVTGPPERIK